MTDNKPSRSVQLSPWTRYLLGFFSGLALPLAFSPYGWWPVAIVSIALLFIIIQGVSNQTALRTGAVFGLGYFGIGVYWIYFSLHLFGDAIAPLAALLTLVFVLVMAVFPALTAYVYSKLEIQSKPFSNSLLFASTWVVFELLRGKVLDGFPWILLGYSQTDGPLGHLAPLIGVYGISFLVVLVAVLLATISLLLIHRIITFKQVAVPVIIVMLVFASGAYSKHLSYSQPIGTSLNVRLVQANIPQALKFSQERLRRSIVDYTTLTQQPGIENIDLVVWPETAIPTYMHRIEEALTPFISSMDQRGVDILTGVFVKEEDAVYNAVRQLGGDKNIYRKRHLVPFGEYMPLRFILDFAAKYIDIPMSDLAADDGPHKPLTVQGIPMGISICYENVYGEEQRHLLPDSHMLVNVSNDAWFGDSSAPYQHEQKARMRAKEFARPMIRVTNTGISSFIDYDGQIKAQIPHNQAGIVDVTLQPRQGLTPYAATGNYPIIAVTLLILFGGYLLKRKNRAE